MTRLIRTEWLKLATTRGPWAVIAGVLALTALITPFAMADIGQGDASRAADAREALAIGPGFITALMLLLIGALAAAGEFHHRSIVSTYLITPRRGRILAAKLIAHATLGAVVAAIGVAISFPIVLLMARGEHLTVASNGHLVARRGRDGRSGRAGGGVRRGRRVDPPSPDGRDRRHPRLDAARREAVRRLLPARAPVRRHHGGGRARGRRRPGHPRLALAAGRLGRRVHARGNARHASGT